MDIPMEEGLVDMEGQVERVLELLPEQEEQPMVLRSRQPFLDPRQEEIFLRRQEVGVELFDWIFPRHSH